MENKIYIVIGNYGEYEEYTEQLLYVGNDKNKAETTDLDSYDGLTLQVWTNEIHTQTFIKDGISWINKYDRTNEIKNEIEKAKKLINEYESLLKQIEE